MLTPDIIPRGIEIHNMFFQCLCILNDKSFIIGFIKIPEEGSSVSRYCLKKYDAEAKELY